jgi:hypothetical protein
MAKQANKPTTIPRVPLQTPMFEDPDGANPWPWNLSRTWIIFFERIFKGNTNSSTNNTGAAGPFHRTLLLKDTTVGNDIADHTTIEIKGTAGRLTGTLRLPITADLIVRCMIAHAGDIAFVELISLTIPSGHPINSPIDGAAFTSDAAKSLLYNDVVRWDVMASDGNTDRAGVASFDLIYQ